jgi:hypothetical protein
MNNSDRLERFREQARANWSETYPLTATECDEIAERLAEQEEERELMPHPDELRAAQLEQILAGTGATE